MQRKTPSHPRSFWEKLVAEYRRGGHTRREICARHDVAVSALSYWCGKLNKEKQGSNANVALVPVEIAQQGPAAKTSEIMVQVGSIKFTFSAGIDPAYLASLFAWTERTRC